MGEMRCPALENAICGNWGQGEALSTTARSVTVGSSIICPGLDFLVNSKRELMKYVESSSSSKGPRPG